MQKNSDDFNMQEAMRLAKSPAGKQLIEMLQQADAKQVQQATQYAKSGNYAQAISMLKDILSTPDGQKLLKEFGR